LITAGAKGDHNTEQYNITDALTVYNSLVTE
jgi:D-alanyl-D-alanine carboxypeptidase (penicillin-binding protein 5/6)